MDDSVLEKFQSTFLIAGEVTDARGPHPHYSLYKSKKDHGSSSQETRRKKCLEEQLSRRRDYADHARKMADGGEMWGESADDNMEDGGVDEVDSEMKDQGSERKKKNRYPYRNQLMLSEWLVDIPNDFEENWLAVVVPVGRRSLIISARKTTYAYSRSGGVINNFPSLLPGGSRQTHRLQRDYCILDCVFYESTQTFYILDLMCWGGHPIYDSELEFRTFWKEQKCRENDSISTYSRINPLIFQDLCYHSCTRESLTSLLAESPPYQVDGLLFIHKKCRYVIGRTPLAVWLKPRMVPDILGIPVSSEFLAKSPELPSQSPGRGKERMDTLKEPKKERMDTLDEPSGEVNLAET